MVLAWLLVGLAVAGAGLRGALPERVAGFVEDGGWAGDPTPRGFRIVALSNLAEGCLYLANREDLAREEALRCADAAVAGALAQSPYKSPIGQAKLGDHGMYLAHLAVALAARERLAGDGRYRTLHERIARHLAARSLADERAHAASYAGIPARWPADQSTVLYALRRYDQLHGTDLAPEPIRRWLAYMAEEGADRETGLHRSEVAGVTRTSAVPRGCALSWTVRYMAAFAPEEARDLWDAYVYRYRVDVGPLLAFREWPLGQDHGSDVDSGPVVAGVGVAATALALAASRAVDDDLTWAGLRATESAGWLMAGRDPQLSKVSSGLLPVALSLTGRTLTEW